MEEATIDKFIWNLMIIGMELDNGFKLRCLLTSFSGPFARASNY